MCYPIHPRLNTLFRTVLAFRLRDWAGPGPCDWLSGRASTARTGWTSRRGVGAPLRCFAPIGLAGQLEEKAAGNRFSRLAPFHSL